MELGRKKKTNLKENLNKLCYLEIRRQLVRGEDTQFDLGEADLQVLEVVTFGRSSILVVLLVEVFIQPLQLCSRYSFIFIITLCFLTTSHMLTMTPTNDPPASVCPYPKKLSSLSSSFSSMLTVKRRAVTMRCCEHITLRP